jgi:hypothetical protein
LVETGRTASVSVVSHFHSPLFNTTSYLFRSQNSNTIFIRVRVSKFTTNSEREKLTAMVEFKRVKDIPMATMGLLTVLLFFIASSSFVHASDEADDAVIETLFFAFFFVDFCFCLC